jgi:hypothetical protein
MTTPINKITRRRTGGTYRDRSTLRPIIVSLEPGDLLGFRYQGTRRTYRLPIAAVMQRAIWAQSEDDRWRKAAERKAKRGA